MPRVRNPDPIDILASFSPDDPGFPVAELTAYLGRRMAGTLILTRMDDEELFPACLRNVRRLRTDEDDDRLGILAVSNVRVEAWARNRGVGVALYVEAAHIARRRFRAMIVSHECVGGQTTAEAGRVWESARFRDAVSVRGQAGVYHLAPTAVRNPARPSRRR